MDKGAAHQQALAMLEAFASVGADRFDVTWRTMETDERDFRKGVPPEVLRQHMPTVLDQAARQQRNVIVRPYGPPVFLQLDDLKTEAVGRAAPLAFLTLETSPGNHQAWLAIDGRVAEDFGSRVRKGAGADLYASGATRVAGSFNFKPQYAPDFPLVSIGEVAPGRKTTPAELTRAGLVAPAERVDRPRVSRPGYRDQRSRKWPDYEQCLLGAPANAAGDGPKRAAADFTWCMIAVDWGFSLHEVVARLLEQSTKAQENGKGYALKTATKAAQAAARNKGQGSPRLTIYPR